MAPSVQTVMLIVAAAAPLASAAAASPAPKVLVTGASGGTGRLLYQQLKADKRVAEVRALVRAGSGEVDKARAALNCTRCDASEGIFYGDVTIPSSLVAPVRGMDTIAITVGVGMTANASLMRAVEFTGVENQVRSMGAPSAGQDFA